MTNSTELEDDSNTTRDARMILQMTFSKIHHIKKVVERMNFKSSDGKVVDDIIDPTVIAVLIRNIYETIGMFQLVYIKPSEVDESKILCNQ